MTVIFERLFTSGSSVALLVGFGCRIVILLAIVRQPSLMSMSVGGQGACPLSELVVNALTLRNPQNA